MFLPAMSHNRLLLLCAAAATVAPAGSFTDKGVGKLCPKGTYTTSLSNASVCTPCSTGITTSTEGSSSVAECSYALPGYKKTGSNAASLCPVHTYTMMQNPTQAPAHLARSSKYSLGMTVSTRVHHHAVQA